MSEYQVAIIGGGPAGLAAALTLSRSMVRHVVFDAPAPARNAAATHVAAFPAMDMVEPASFRKAVRTEIERYGYTSFRATEIMKVEPGSEGGFALIASDAAPVATADRVLLTTGMVDLLPPIAGLEALWGRSVINCPFCHGFERRDRAWGILVDRPEILAAAEVYRNWSADLIMFISPKVSLGEERREALERMGVRFIHGEVTALKGLEGELSSVVMASGDEVSRDVLLVWPLQAQTALISALSPALDDEGYVEVDAGFATSTPGIYAAGDLVYGGHQNINTAIHQGNMAAATMVFDLCQDAFN